MGVEPPVSDALPFKGRQDERAAALGISTALWLRKVAWIMSTYWRTLGALAVLLFFPRLASALLAMMIRLDIRLCTALLMRVFHELWLELDGVVHQLTLLTSGFENTLVQYLDGIMHEYRPTSASPPPAPSVVPAWVEGAQGPPAQPSQVLTHLLLALNVLLQLRHMHGGLGLG